MKMKVVLVRFVTNEGDISNSKKYAYFTNLELKKGDIVVVEARNFMGLAVVTDVRGLTVHQVSAATRWVITKVDDEGLKDVKAQAELYFELKNKLREAKERFEEQRIYEVLAAEDEEIAKLLAEFKKISGGNLLT